jgi:hypothetical protein
MTATLKIATTGFAFALATTVLAGPASAREVSISGTHSAAEIKATCAKVGGDYVEGGGGYGCENPAKSTSVMCRDGKCTGFVPDRPAGGTRTPTDDIFGLPLQP